MKEPKLWIVYTLFLINTTIFLIYMVLDLLEIKVMGKLDFTFLLCYELLTLIISLELVHAIEKSKNRDKNKQQDNPM